MSRARSVYEERKISCAEALATLILDMLEAREPSLASGRGLDLFMYYFIRELYLRIPPASPSGGPISPATSLSPDSKPQADVSHKDLCDEQPDMLGEDETSEDKVVAEAAKEVRTDPRLKTLSRSRTGTKRKLSSSDTDGGNRLRRRGSPI